MSAPRSALVTGAAGFIGSRLVERLVGDGWRVTGIDSFSPYYDVSQKRANAARVEAATGVRIQELDLLDADLTLLLEPIDVVFHQAGQPGVRASWDGFASYVTVNVDATQRLLEAARKQSLHRFVFASSSSVYGDAEAYPTEESALPRPMSPYGVTKLAAEHLCGVYARNWAVPTVSLRYFTVYGPGQRPDMAMHKLVEAALSDRLFQLYGDGEQIRDFTFVDDIVAANLAVATAPVLPGSVYNVAGGGSHSMNEVISLIERILGRPIRVERGPAQAGDVQRTGGSVRALQGATGWKPNVTLEEGLTRQVEWHRNRRRSPSEEVQQPLAMGS